MKAIIISILMCFAFLTSVEAQSNKGVIYKRFVTYSQPKAYQVTAYKKYTPKKYTPKKKTRAKVSVKKKKTYNRPKKRCKV